MKHHCNPFLSTKHNSIFWNLCVCHASSSIGSKVGISSSSESSTCSALSMGSFSPCWSDSVPWLDSSFTSEYTKVYSSSPSSDIGWCPNKVCQLVALEFGRYFNELERNCTEENTHLFQVECDGVCIDEIDKCGSAWAKCSCFVCYTIVQGKPTP